jgi:hypothetical protein
MFRCFDASAKQGKSSKFAPHAQKVSLHHAVQDEDVVSSAYKLPPLGVPSCSHDCSFHKVVPDRGSEAENR